MRRTSLRDNLVRGNRRRSKRRKSLLVWGIVGAIGVTLAILLLWLGNTEPPTQPEREAVENAEGQPSAEAANEQRNPLDEGPAGLSAEEETETPGDGAGAQPDLPSAETRQRLEDLEIVSGKSVADYDRDLFGQAWFDVDRNGCDTRNDILGRDIVNAEFKPGTSDCKVLSGVLEDWYSGTSEPFVSGRDSSYLVQVDHMVPLSWAWKHGAEHWNSERLLAFANDPLNLVATLGDQNQQKSDSGPSHWLPAADAAQCRYVQRFTDVLHAYDLGINLRDRAMIRGVLAECDESLAFGPFVTGGRADGTER